MSPITGLGSLRRWDLTSSSQSSSGRSSSEPAPLSASRATKCLTVEGDTLTVRSSWRHCSTYATSRRGPTANADRSKPSTFSEPARTATAAAPALNSPRSGLPWLAHRWW